jgi:hypothetical protein
MRYSRLAGLVVAAALALPQLALAQTPRVEITGVRIGFRGSIIRSNNRGAAQTRFKSGAWAPVEVDLEVKDAPLQAGSYILVVETTDSDDMQNVYVETRFLPTIQPKEQPTLLAYVRPGGSNSEVTVTVQQGRLRPDGTLERGQVLRWKKLTQVDVNPLPPSSYGYLTLGGRVRSLYKALATPPNVAVNMGPGAAPRPAVVDEDTDPEENGNRSFAHLDQVSQMPTYWFGYQPADMVLMLTATQQFVADLSGGQQDDPISVRREALAEWVRRGGRLVVSVSKNHQEVNKILEQMKIIPALAVEGQLQVPQLPGVERWAGAGVPFRGLGPKNQPGAPAVVDIAKLKAGPGVEVLAYDKVVPGPDAHPVIVQAPCGLGRVIVVGFDLDQAPFTTWGGRTQFWKQFVTVTEPNGGVGDQIVQGNPWGVNANQGNELAAKLVHSLEAFPDVPVISFGWVALFILVYILIVGPLDYFFLKKVVKRLELTWITFPAVVIVISAVAYFAAYYLKGSDLRINKVDIVDVDLHGGHAYGTTWFTLFSPRIQNYTIGVEPGTGWGAEEKDPKKYAPFVGWMGRPEEGWGGTVHGGSQGLFRRAYDYAPESSGLLGVPIQVWSTKTFSGSWYRAIKDNELLETDFRVPNNDQTRMKLSGTITSHLPVELQDVALFYRGKYYALDNLAPDNPQRIDAKMDKGNDAQNWFGQSLAPLNAPLVQSGRPRPYMGQDAPQPVGLYVKSILFSGDKAQQGTRNSLLRFLDERWRLDKDNTKEAVLFGRAVPPAGKGREGGAEEMSRSGLSASKLWLGKLPGSGKRDDIPGTLSQETFVRVYIPVNTSK